MCHVSITGSTSPAVTGNTCPVVKLHEYNPGKGLGPLSLLLPCAPTAGQARRTRCQGPCTLGSIVLKLRKAMSQEREEASSCRMSDNVKDLPATAGSGI